MFYRAASMTEFRKGY